ncbi:MAG TPA: iron-containing alcohol dehydrogenase [Acidimicrobiales bacterium]|nr:iron-containing alcohol dehydrogenase [Acidimicrobiales bacterium]
MSDRWVHTGFAQRIHFGAGAVSELGSVVREVGGRRVMLLSSQGRLASPEGDGVRRALGRTVSVVFDGVRPHVPASVVKEAVAAARADDVDTIVSFGGGSAADTGKAVCFFLEQERGTPGASYVDRPGLAHVSVPTTYSGAELTPFFGMTDPVTRTKQGGGGPTVAPLAAVYDPNVTVGTPADVSAQTGMNALAHGVECAYSPRCTPEAELIALGCVRTLVASLPRVVADPTDMQARSDALTGAMLGGRCLHNATMGVHHGLAQLVGGRTGMPHGLANALLLSHAVRFNLEAIGPAAARIGAALGDEDDPAGAVDRLRAGLGLPGRLSEAGMTEEDLDAVVRASQANPSVKANPRPVDAEGARSILEAAF